MPSLPRRLRLVPWLLWLPACAPEGARLHKDPGSADDSAEDTSPRDTTGDTSRDSPGDSAIEVVPGAPDPSDAVFDPSVVHEIVLEMDPSAWIDVRDNPWARSWQPARFSFDGEPALEVEIRAFGAGSMVAGKPSLKIDLDRRVPGQSWRGLDELKLDNSAQDRGFLNEFTASAILRAMGVPAARTGWADLTVNGAHAGFFVLLEPIDDEFVERWYGHDDGHLYSTNEHYWGQGLNPIAGDPALWYAAQTATGGDATDVAALAALVASGSDDDLLASLDVEGFFRESVTRSVLGSLDAFSADANNFYLYEDHGLWRLIPWDFDADLGYPWYFDRALGVDLRQPHLSSPWAYNCVSGVAYADPVLRRALDMGLAPEPILEELLAGPLAWTALEARIADAAALIRPHVEADVLGYGPYFTTRQADLRLFLHARLTALTGAEIVPCEEIGEGARVAADLAPTGSVGWGSLMVDGTNWGPGFVVNGKAACRGLFAHAPSAVTLSIPDGYGFLSGKVGLQDWNRQGRCDNGSSFSIQQEGATLWSSGLLLSYTDALPFGPVEVRPGPLLLKTDTNGDYACDTTAWLDLVLTP
jgi:hypothetical protein